MNFVWLERLEDKKIARYFAAKKQQKLIKIMALGMAILGIIALGMYATTSWGEAKSGWLMIFFISLWTDMYLVTEKIRGELQKNKWGNLRKKLEKNAQLEIEVAAILSEEVREAIYRAHRDGEQIDTLKLMAELIKTPRWSYAAERMGINIVSLSEMLRKKISENIASGGEGLTAELWTAMQEAAELALERGLPEVDTATTARAIYMHSEILHEMLMELGVDEAEFNGCLDWLQVEKILAQRAADYKKLARLKVTGDMNATYTASATPILNSYAEDLTAMAARGELMLCMGRDKEMEKTAEIFESGSAGVILVGAAQVGKRSIIEGMAQHMVEERVPKIMQDKRLVALNLERILGGEKQETAQKKLMYILDEVRQAGNIILVIENIDTILSAEMGAAEAGGSAGIDVGKILAQALVSREIMLLATSQEKVYEHYVEKQPLGQNLRLLRIAEPGVKETVEILMTKTPMLEKKYAIKITYDALMAAAEMAKRYVAEKRLPASAIEVLELAALKASTKEREKGGRATCSEAEVMAVVSNMTNMPMEKVGEAESAKLLGLEDELHKYVIGQKRAVDVVAKALRRARTDLQQNKDQPLASFLFLGPTGVGKTELSKTVAKVYFGGSENMIRLDMSEYQLPTDVAKMIGTPDGNSLGYLTEAVRKKPYSLILFDEIEKAHPDMLNLFLQMLDDGRMTNGLGVTVDFANTIIVATSNVGAIFIQEAVREGKNYEEIKGELLNKLLFEKFSPEFVNRFDEVVVLSALSENETAQIVGLVMGKVAQNLQEKGMRLEIDEETMRAIARASYDPQYGARPIRRYIKDNIESEIANLLLENKLERRDTVVVSAAADGRIIVEARKAEVI